MSNTYETPWTVADHVPLSMGFPRQNTGVGCQILLQGIFLTQGSTPHLLYYCWAIWEILYRWAIWEALYILTKDVLLFCVQGFLTSVSAYTIGLIHPFVDFGS